MDDHDVERLLTRYRPADPPASLDARIGRLIDTPVRQPRVWPWAVAAAVLLAITVGLHGEVRAGQQQRSSESHALLAQQLGGDAIAADAARLMEASQPRKASRVRRDVASELR